MDSRDSSSSSSLNAGGAGFAALGGSRDGGGSGGSVIEKKDDVVTAGGGDDPAAADVMKYTSGRAKEAARLFQSGEYSECLDILLELSQKTKDDPKVFHNIAIAEYFRDGCSDKKKLFEDLIKVKARSEELVREHANASGNANVSGSKGSVIMPNQLSAAISGSAGYSDDFDTSVVSLNLGVACFHLHEYKKALSLLKPVLKKNWPIDETVVINICLLLLDAALASHDTSTSAVVINYMDKTFNFSFTVSQGDHESLVKLQASNLIPKASTFPATADTAISDATDGSLSRCLSEDAVYENYISTFDTVGNYSSTSNPSKTLAADRTIPTMDLKLKLQLYKVQFLLLTRNLKAAKREVKEAVNMAREQDSPMVLVLKSQLEYACGNHLKAMKILEASRKGVETGLSTVFNNNFGCIYFEFGKQHTSSVFFLKAVNSIFSTLKQKPRKMSGVLQDKSHFVMYNCGVQYLACGKPILAARCFQKASLVFHNNPILWLRIADCCIMALEKGLLRSDTSSDELEVKLNVIGKGKWRQLVIDDSGSKAVHRTSLEKSDLLLGGDKKQPKLSLSLARQCLVNALYLLSCSETKHVESGSPLYPIATPGSNLTYSNGDAKDQKGGTSLEDLLNNSISDYKEIREKEKRIIKQAVLVNLAYIELELNNPVKALSSSVSLLNVAECSRVNTFFGHVYAAEALLLLNRPKEAAEHLLTYLSGGNKLDLPYREEDCNQQRVDTDGNSNLANWGTILSPEDARGTIYANLAVTLAIEGDFEQAHLFAKQAMSALPSNRKAILAAAYVDMKSGKAKEALAKLKHCSGVRFVNGNVSR